MIEKKRRCAAFAVCGSFCTLEAALDAARALRGQGWELLPVMSFAAGQDTRFGRASGWRHQLEGLTGRPVLDTLQAVEPLGPWHLADALVLYQRKHYYFVPYGQDDPNTKPQSLKARFELLPQTLEAALEGQQLQPVLQCPCG